MQKTTRHAAIRTVVVVGALSGAIGLTIAACAARPRTPRVPTFQRDVAPILWKRCASCHHTGEVAPFPLVSYDDARRHARQIAAVTRSRFMPPWRADSHGEFLDERRLTDDEVATLRDWAATGAKRGDARQPPALPTFTDRWRLGAPDAVVEMPEAYRVEADGADVYRCFVVPTAYAQDRFLSAVEFAPGNRTVVHHVIAYLDTNGDAKRLDAADPGPGYTSHGGGPGFLPAGLLGGWAPGNEPRHLPEGIGILLPKGADIVLEVHYHKSGKPETDRTRVGLYFSKTPVDKRIRYLPVINPFFKIPAGAANHVVRAEMPVRRDITVLSVTPHMHLLGRSMRVDATLPGGAVRPLVNVPDWDFRWQNTYTYREPFALPGGSRLRLVATYDNSTANPRNPSQPPRDVGWGEQTTDEMCIAFVGYTVDKEQLTRGVSGDLPGYRPYRLPAHTNTPSAK